MAPLVEPRLLDPRGHMGMVLFLAEEIEQTFTLNTWMVFAVEPGSDSAVALFFAVIKLIPRSCDDPSNSAIAKPRVARDWTP